MAKQPVERVIRDDPDQLFFDFALPAPPSAGGTPAVRSDAVLSGRAETPAPPAFQASPRTAAAPRPPTFLTESRAEELILEAARECGNDEITAARVAFKPFRVTLYSYRIRRNGRADVKLHVAFRNAPENVVAQAARLMLTRRRRARRALDRAAYDAFVRALRPGDFELPGARRGHRMSVCGPGRHHSLPESFQRVNAEYFRSQLEQPELCWSKDRARRILGSFQERADRVIVSRVFDAPKVPVHVLDYLMYHELLHKFLGTGRHDNGRRCLHGKDFRRLEKQFKFYKEAQAFLKRM